MTHQNFQLNEGSVIIGFAFQVNATYKSQMIRSLIVMILARLNFCSLRIVDQ